MEAKTVNIFIVAVVAKTNSGLNPTATPYSMPPPLSKTIDMRI
jgi:hypothetical protein